MRVEESKVKNEDQSHPPNMDKPDTEREKELIVLAGEISAMIGSAATLEVELDSARNKVAGFDRGFDSDRAIVANIRSRASKLDAEVTELASAAEETAAATEEMAASIDRISHESSSRYADLVDISELSLKGQKEMGNTLAVVNEVTNSVDALRSFIDAINDIAERTSLLAMNASIEAAHAGNAGKGFAVIAGEVRKLAASAAENSASITGRLKGLIDTIRKAEVSTATTSEIYGHVEERMQKATESFLVIKSGTEELAIGGREIQKAVGSFRSASAGIQESSKELSTDADMLERQTDSLSSESKEIADRLSTLGQDTGTLNVNVLTSATSTITILKSSSIIPPDSHSSKLNESVLSLLRLQHQAWVARARAVLDGKLKLDSSTVGDHHLCDLGKWMDAEGKQYLAKSAWQAINEQHESLHKAAKEIIRLAGAGEIQEAEKLFSDLQGYSRKTIKLLQDSIDQ